MKNEKALGAFMAKIAEAQTLLAELQAHVDDHMGASPEEINYGHVGSAGYMVEKTQRTYRLGFGARRIRTINPAHN